VAAACRDAQFSAQGHWMGRCRSSRRAVEAIRPGTWMILRRRLDHLALARSAATAAARAMLNAITARETQAALAAYFPSVIFSPCAGRVADLQVCVVDGVVDGAARRPSSARSDEFGGLPPGRVAV